MMTKEKMALIFLLKNSPHRVTQHKLRNIYATRKKRIEKIRKFYDMGYIIRTPINGVFRINVKKTEEIEAMQI